MVDALVIAWLMHWFVLGREGGYDKRCSDSRGIFRKASVRIYGS